MSFKYVNPGYAALLNGDEIQYNNLPSTKSKTGTGVSVVSSDDYYYEYFVENFELTYQSGFAYIPATSDIWARLDFYIFPDFTYSTGVMNWRCYLSFPYASEMRIVFISQCTEVTPDFLYTVSITVYIGSSSNVVATIENATEKQIKETLGLKFGGVNTLWAHVSYNTESSTVDATIDFKINGKEYSATGASSASWDRNIESYRSVRWTEHHLENTTLFILSNIIVSDEYIDPNEKIIPLIIDETKSTMTTLEGGLYRAERVGQKVLQSADALSLADIYGADSKVTGVFMAGYPAYADSGSETLTAISTFGTDTTMHGVYNLSDATDTLIFSAWNTASDMTVADLNGVSFGWRAGGYFEL